MSQLVRSLSLLFAFAVLLAAPSQAISEDRPAASGGKAAGSPLPAQPVGVKPRDEKPAVDSAALFEQGGALTPRGQLVFEPSFQYSHSSTNLVSVVGYTIIPSITVGLINIKNVESNTLVGSLGLRYGLTSRLEGEVKVPYVYRTESTSTDSAGTGGQNVTSVFSADGNDLGDVEFGLRYQLNRVGPSYWLLGLRVKSNTGKDPFQMPVDPVTGFYTELPTGSGFWGIQPGLTLIVPSDPAVFFGSVSYMFNIPRNISGVGDVDPGDIIDANFGLGFALNDKTSISLGYDHSIVGRVKRDESYLPGTMVTQLGTLLIGFSFRASESMSYVFSLGAGLTQAAPDVQLTVKVPFTL